jgi:hypothetical protein
LKVCEIRMNQVLREWNWIVDKVKKKVKQYVQFVDFICRSRALHLNCCWELVLSFHTTSMC